MPQKKTFYPKEELSRLESKKVIDYYENDTDIINPDKITESYNLWLKKEEEKFKEIIPNTSKVLEVGAGNGRIINSLMGKSLKITGIDLANIPLLKAKMEGAKDVDVIKMDAENLNFKDNSFDYCIIAYNSLGVFQNPDKVLEECKRVTRNNGEIILSTYELDENYALKERIKCFSKIGHKIKVKGLQLEIPDGVASHYFTKDELSELFESVSLEFEYIPLTKLGCLWISKIKK